MNFIDQIIAYEDGNLTAEEELNLFALLIKNKSAWSLQGHYGRTANALIQNGILTKKGDIL